MLCCHPGNLRSQNCTVRTVNRRYIHLSILRPPSRVLEVSQWLCLHVCRVCCAFQHVHKPRGWSACQTTEKSGATWFPSCPRPSSLHKCPPDRWIWKKSRLESGRARKKATAAFSTLKCRQAHEEDGVRNVEGVSLQSRVLSTPPCPMVMQTMF